MHLADLFRSCHRDLLRQAGKLLRCPDRAEDVAQDAFAGLMARAAVAAVPEPRAYLFAATRNLSLDRLRRARAAPQADRAVLATLQDPSPTAEAIACSRQQMSALAAALNELPDATRTAFLLARVEGLSHREVAARLGVSVSMVEKHVARALDHARQRLLPE